MQAFWRPRPVQQHNTQQLSLQQQQQGQQAVAADPQQRQLGADQQRAVAAVLQGDCVFLTGGAGVGKSFTVAEVVRALQTRGKVVAVTASTGTAAVNVDGMTLHSWAGILDVEQHMVRLAETLWEWDKFRQQWRGTDVLLVDEISMVGADLIEKVDYLARYLRGWRISPHTELPGVDQVHELHPEPFGGLQVVSVGDFFQLPPVDKDNTSTITMNSGHAPPASACGRARSYQQQQQQQQRDEDEDEDAKVPVIVAVLPPGFITAAAAARRFMGVAAEGGAAAVVSTAVAAEASPLPATAGAAGYPMLGALQGGFLGPVQGYMQPQQQQQRVKAEIADLQSSRQQQQIRQIKPEIADLLASPLKQQQQRWQRVETGEVVDLLASPPKQRRQHQVKAETVDLLESGDEDSTPRLQQQQQHRRRSAEAMELGLDQLDMSPSKRQRSALKQELHSTRLAATAADVVAAAAVSLPEDAGVDMVRPFGVQLPAAAAAAALDSPEPAVPAVSPLPDVAAARGACGDSSGAAASAAAAAVAAPSGFSRLALTSPTSSSSSSRMRPGGGLLCFPAAAAAAAAAAGAVDEPTDLPAACSAAAAAGAVDIDSFEMVPSNEADSDGDCVIVEAEHDVIDLSMSQPDQQQQLPAAPATGSARQPWQIVEQGRQQQDMVIDLSASQPDEQQQQQQGAAAGGLQQQHPQHPPLVIKQDPQQQQPPLEIKQEPQQHQQQRWHGWSGVLPQVKKQSPLTTANPNSLSSPHVQPQSAAAAAAAAAAGAAGHPSSSSMQGIDGPYTQHGKHPFRRVLQGRVYAAEPGPGLNNRLNLRGSNSSRMRGLTSSAPLQQGLGSSTSAAAAAAVAGDSGPRLPVTWLKGLRPKDYCFKSPVWAAAGFKPIILKKPYRQSEGRLLDMLDKVRYGNFDWSVQQMLHQELQRPLDESDGIKPTELFPTNKQVERLNAVAYSLLPGPELKTVCCDRCEPQGAVSCDFMAKQLDQNTNAQQSLDLKPGAQVVLLWNLEVGAGLANGTRGVVEGFRGIREYLSQEGVSVQDGQSVGRPTDIGAGCHHSNCSCQAGYCIHQHQQQQQQRPGARVGMCGLANCPCGMDDWSKGKNGGSFFVRLPDATEGVRIQLPDSMPAFRRLQMQNAISWLNHTDTTQLPYVKFSKPPRDANNPHIPNPCRIIGPQTWTHRRRVRAYRGQPAVKVALTRTALPLRLAWALTVHRSQGMSISKLRVHLGKAFGAGMVYVALSRCVSLDGLQVIGRVKAPETDADVLQFYKYIERIEATEL